MKIYQQGGLEDLLLYRWWEQLVLSGDVQNAYTGLDTPSAMFHMMAPPNVLLYEHDESGIWFAMWVESTGLAGFVHMWIAHADRHTKRALKAVLEALRTLLDHMDPLVAVTHIEAVSQEHEKVGFQRLGALPSKGQLLHITYLTKAQFEKETARFQSLTEH
jgi:hypothetical protein